PEPVQPASAWVQVQPGRYVRVEQAVPQDRHADEFGATPSCDPESAQEAVPTADVPAAEAEVEAGARDEVPRDTGGPDDPQADSAGREDRPDPGRDAAPDDPPAGRSRPDFEREGRRPREVDGPKAESSGS